MMYAIGRFTMLALWTATIIFRSPDAPNNSLDSFVIKLIEEEFNDLQVE